MGRLGLLRGASGRYLLVGGSVYLFELAIIVLLQRFGASPTWAVAVSFCLGTLLSFLLQKLVTFGDRRMHRRVIVSQLLATALLICCNLVFSVVLTRLLQRHMPAVVTRTIALAVTTLWNFYLYKTRIFKNADALVG